MTQKFKDNKELFQCIKEWFKEKRIKIKFLKETDTQFPTFIVGEETVTFKIIIFTTYNEIKFEVYNIDCDYMDYINRQTIDYNTVIYGLNVALNVYHSMLTYNMCMKFEEFVTTLN